MFPVTDAQLEALLGNHEMTTRVMVFRGQESLGEIPVADVSVAATYGTRGGRDGELIVDRHIIDSGLLNPMSDQVIIYTGVRDFFEVPIFTGRCDENVEDSDGEVSVPLISRAVEAIEAKFIVPWPATNGNSARTEIMQILKNVDPLWGVDISAANAAPIPPNLVWEEDRGQALDQLAQGANLIWQPDRTGGFVVYDNPYSIGSSLGANVQVFLRDGENGTVAQIRKTTSRAGIFNSVTVVTERVNNTPPIRVTAMDTLPSSPTYWGGLFGKKNLVVKNQVPLDLAGSQLLALRILRQSLAQQRSFEIATPHMPVLDPGDVFALIYRDVVYTLVCETIRYSGSGSQLTQISARELILRESLSLV